MEITFLGTSAMVPTKERNPSGIYLDYKGEGILFDCGEGSQRQMSIAEIKRTSVKKVLISHWHGDHVSGLIGLIQTIGNSLEENKKLLIIGPKETKKRMGHLVNTCIFDTRVELEIKEFDPKEEELLTAFENEDYIIECCNLEHKVPCIGFSFTEKKRLNIDVAKQKKLGIKDGPHLRNIKNGENIIYEGKEIMSEDLTYEVPQRKISYIADTIMCSGALNLSQDSDILIAESTFDSSLEEKAEEKYHMTSKDAALLANNSGSKKLILTHFSQRYKDVKEIEEDAKTYFANTVCAFDFMKIKL